MGNPYGTWSSLPGGSVSVGRAFVVVDGEPVEGRSAAQDGSIIQMGGLVFRLMLEEINGDEQ